MKNIYASDGWLDLDLFGLNRSFPHAMLSKSKALLWLLASVLSFSFAELSEGAGLQQMRFDVRIMSMEENEDGGLKIEFEGELDDAPIGFVMRIPGRSESEWRSRRYTDYEQLQFAVFLESVGMKSENLDQLVEGRLELQNFRTLFRGQPYSGFSSLPRSDWLKGGFNLFVVDTKIISAGAPTLQFTMYFNFEENTCHIKAGPSSM